MWVKGFIAAVFVYFCIAASLASYRVSVDVRDGLETNLNSLPTKLEKLAAQDFLTFEGVPADTNFHFPVSATGTWKNAQTNCFLQPYRCADENDCDCSKICSSADVEQLRVWDDADVYFGDIKLPPGLYCAPKNKTRCKKSVSAMLYANGTWRCHCLYPQIFSGEDCSTFVACRTPSTRTEAKLWDNLTNATVDMNDFRRRNLYELMPSSSKQPRYRCKCDGEDANGNSLVYLPEMPLHCFVDYCKGNVLRSSVPGFDKRLNVCDCGDYSVTRQKHSITGEWTSPCTACVPSIIDERSFRFPLPCFNVRSGVNDLVSRHTLCPTFDNPKTTCNYGIMDVENTRVLNI